MKSRLEWMLFVCGSGLDKDGFAHVSCVFDESSKRSYSSIGEKDAPELENQIDALSQADVGRSGSKQSHMVQSSPAGIRKGVTESPLKNRPHRHIPCWAPCCSRHEHG